MHDLAKHARERRSHFAEITVAQFLKAVLPPPSRAPTSAPKIDLSRVDRVSLEPDGYVSYPEGMASGLAEAFNASAVVPDLDFCVVASPNRLGLSICGLWKSSELPVGAPVDLDDAFPHMALPIIVCNDAIGDDVFRTCGRTTMSTHDARGRLLEVAMRHFLARPTTASFSLLIIGNSARMVCVDHGAVVVSERFLWRRNGTLASFLWHWSQASDDARGVDTSCRRPSPELAETARAALSAYNPGGEYDTANLWAIDMWDDAEDPRVASPVQRVVAAMPKKTHVGVPLGRFTLGYLAYVPSMGTIMFVKDQWCFAHDKTDCQPEGLVLKKLERHGVPHVPRVQCAGYVRLEENAKYIQSTALSAFLNARAKNARVCELVHYRILLKDVGRPLDDFSSSKVLVQAVRDALKAYACAYKRTGILHRDISPGNILITNDGRGLLIDFELCLDTMRHTKEKCSKLASVFTGTPTTMSSIKLMAFGIGKRWEHCASDDLESFFWVLMDVLTKRRFVHANFTENLQLHVDYFDAILHDITSPHFDPRHEFPGMMLQPGAGKHAFLLSTGMLRGPHGLFDFVDAVTDEPAPTALCDMLRELHLHVQSYLRGDVASLSYKHMFGVFNRALRSPTAGTGTRAAAGAGHVPWPANDMGLDIYDFEKVERLRCIGERVSAIVVRLPSVKLECSAMAMLDGPEVAPPMKEEPELVAPTSWGRGARGDAGGMRKGAVKAEKRVQESEGALGFVWSWLAAPGFVMSLV